MASDEPPRSYSATAALIAQAALEIGEEQQGNGSVRSSRTVSAAGIEPTLQSVAEDRPSNRLPPIKALGTAGREPTAFAEMADEPFRLSAGSGLSLSAREASEGAAKDAVSSGAMSKWHVSRIGSMTWSTACMHACHVHPTPLPFLFLLQEVCRAEGLDDAAVLLQHEDAARPLWRERD